VKQQWLPTNSYYHSRIGFADKYIWRSAALYVNLVVKRDDVMCAHLAKEGYGMQVGARSIARAVKETLEAELMRKYYGRSELIEDDNNNSPLEWYVSSYIGIKSVRL